jgi:hypothetical protein
LKWIISSPGRAVDWRSSTPNFFPSQRSDNHANATVKFKCA